jgi:hypothetical protein
MITYHKLYIWTIIIMFIVTACAPAKQPNPADRFAGTWTGTMSFSDDPTSKLDVVVTIPSGCSIGGSCGDISNASGCQWEMTLDSINSEVFEYRFSKTLSGGDPCPTGVGTSGTLTLQKDGTLLREHKTQNFTATGILKHQ